MSKLSTPQGFDKSQMDAEILKKIEVFVDYVNQNTAQIILALTNQLTFGDNFLGQIMTVSAMHRVPIVLPKGSRAVSYIVPLRCAGGSIRSYNYAFNQDGSLSIEFVFDDFVPIQTQNATVASGFVQYQTKAPMRAGDRASISGYGNTALNKNITILEVSSTVPQYVTAYTSDALAASETKSSYSGDSESAKSITLFVGN